MAEYYEVREADDFAMLHSTFLTLEEAEAHLESIDCPGEYTLVKVVHHEEVIATRRVEETEDYKQAVQDWWEEVRKRRGG